MSLETLVGCFVVMMVLWGHITPQLMREIMSLLKDGLELFKEGHLDTGHIDKLAGLGSCGNYSNNIWSDFKRMLPAPKLGRLQMVQFPLNIQRWANLSDLFRCCCLTLCLLPFMSIIQ